ncbi:uncharacterized protein BYT42DRAFT_12017 [Radiomyces spectabilis]|uniref:uncharacterized protein n=1 Tax=Radiomyces spectabilis TaxID=64574 RepID=UPI0022201128|nr:uncharacterized protein BYT42DRAFT_12017 [Radiomyces spectabilis]KAI8393570.1 hypothetical protein BYT42DRAFT_12017 [Radiomyces spectabilis]
MTFVSGFFSRRASVNFGAGVSVWHLVRPFLLAAFSLGHFSAWLFFFSVGPFPWATSPRGLFPGHFSESPSFVTFFPGAFPGPRFPFVAVPAGHTPPSFEVALSLDRFSVSASLAGRLPAPFEVALSSGPLPALTVFPAVSFPHGLLLRPPSTGHFLHVAYLLGHSLSLAVPGSHFFPRAVFPGRFLLGHFLCGPTSFSRGFPSSFSKGSLKPSSKYTFTNKE